MATVSRFEKVLKRHPSRFVDRILADAERPAFEASEDPCRFLAKRFAAKEAAMKALGTGARGGVRFTDFYIEKNPLNKPILRVQGVARERCMAVGIVGMHVSISDEGDQVVAFVVLENSNNPSL